MTRHQRAATNPIRGFLPGAVLGMMLAGTAAPLAAQEDEGGGVLLRFNFNQRLEATENAGLDNPSEGSTWDALTALGLALSSQTRTDALRFNLNGTLRHTEAPDDSDDQEFGLTTARAGLDYRHSAATTRFNAGLNVRFQDISYLRSLTELLDEAEEEDEALSAEEIEYEQAEGTRRRLSARTGLRFGVGTPTEGGLRLTARHVDHFDTDGAGFADSRRYGLRGDLALQLAPDLRGTAALGYATFEAETGPLRETWTLDLGLRRQLMRGTLSADLGLSQIAEGTRTSLSAGWAQDLPTGALSLRLGGTQSATGNTSLTGALNYRRQLRNGEFSARLRRSVSSGSGDRETLTTNLSANYGRQLSPLTRVQFNVAYADSQSEGSDARISRGELGLGVSRKLSADWNLNAGYTRVMRHDWSDGTGAASSDSLYLSIGRSFAFRY